MKKNLVLISLAALCLFAVSCDKDNNNQESVVDDPVVDDPVVEEPKVLS